MAAAPGFWGETKVWLLPWFPDPTQSDIDQQILGSPTHSIATPTLPIKNGPALPIIKHQGISSCCQLVQPTSALPTIYIYITRTFQQVVLGHPESTLRGYGYL